MSPLAVAFQPAVTFLSDVPNEVEKHRELLAAIRNAHCIPLGDNKSSKGLIADYVSHENPIFSSVGACLSQNGMGQLCGLGRIATIGFVRSDQFANLADTIRTEYALANKGLIPPPTIHSFGSMNGGVNSGAAPVLIDFIQRSLEENNIPVEASFHLVDSTSYIGLGKSIEANCATAISSLVDLAQRVNHAPDSNRVINLRFISLPPTGADWELRKQLAILEAQAWLSPEVQEWLQIVGPNLAHSHPLGNVLQTNAEFFSTIPSASIVNEIARAYFDDVQAGLKQAIPALHTIRHVDAVSEKLVLPRSSIEEISGNHNEFTPDQFLQAVQEKGFETTFKLSVEDIRGRSFECARLPDYFAPPAKSLNDAIDSITTVHSIHDKLIAERSILQRRDLALRKQAKKQQLVIRKWKSKRIRSDRGHFKIAVRLRRFGSQLRNLSDQINENQVLLQEISKCTKIASELLERQRSLPEAVLRMLDSHKLPLNDFELQGLVYFTPTNDVYGKLLAMLPASKPTQSELLAMNATSVTEQGLKHILNVSSADCHHLAAVVVGDAFTPGAWLGGIARSPHQTIVVFPQMSAAIANSLRNEIRKLRPDWLVFFTDTCALGANVLRINICYPKSKEECLPGVLGTILEQSKISPVSVLQSVSSEKN